MNDCDSEAQSGIYKNQLLRKGFFGKTVIVTRPLIDANVEEYLNDGTLNPEYIKAQSEAELTKKTLEDFVGAENAGGAMLVQMDFAGDKFEDAILFKNIESNINPDLFQNVENSVRENILIAFNNLPVGLVKSNEGIFSNSGEAIKEMKKTYWENTSKERNILETIINDLLKGFSKYNGEYLTIKPLIDDNNQVNNEVGNTTVQAN